MFYLLCIFYRGMLAKYADPKLKEQEKAAWEKAAVEKYGNA